MLVDKQGALKTKLSPMHPEVLFTRQSGLVIVLWLVFLFFVAMYTGTAKG